MAKEKVSAKSASVKASGRFENDFQAIITDMSRSQDSKDRGKTWSYHETLELIKNWGEDEMQTQLSTTLRNYHVYGLIAKKMAERGYWRTAEQCRCKIKGMKLIYRKCKEDGDPEKAQKSFTYYRLMDSIMSRKPVSSPPSSSRVREKGQSETEQETHSDTSLTSGPVIENVTTADNDSWSGVCTKVEITDRVETGFDETSNRKADDYEDYDENSNELQLVVGDGNGDSDPETSSMPLDVQIVNSGEDEAEEEAEDSDITLPKMAKTEIKRESKSRRLSPVDSPCPKRKKSSKTSRQQEHLADRILDKFLINEERLVRLFLEAEERMMAKVVEIEERRMNFEQELAERQHREETQRFERLIQVLNHSQAQPLQQAPPRVVYMQEVNPPNWNA